ncbi:hypothetical protein E2C01_087795 [Portunus trituberculatus]|uniref:Uncharacterized protein n=1 Tax=Portunus trituberculatus TaxID=210409 RepID=A0A5B7J4F8_PORTR|nr:hypothetical protein [Portunus trituberculatus]
MPGGEVMASTGASRCGGHRGDGWSLGVQREHAQPALQCIGALHSRFMCLFHIYLELLISKRIDEVIACEHRDHALWRPGISAAHQRLQVLCQPQEWLPLAPGPLLKLSPIHLSLKRHTEPLL